MACDCCQLVTATLYSITICALGGRPGAVVVFGRLILVVVDQLMAAAV